MSIESVLRALLLAAALAGCAHQQVGVAIPDTSGLWRDSAHSYPASASVVLPATQVFALDSQLVQELASFTASTPNGSRRFEHLLDTLFGHDQQDFPYLADRTTPASETWRNRGGNCISLAIMTLALTEQLELTAKIQEVQVTGVWERRGELNLLFRHINVLVHRPMRTFAGVFDSSGEVVIDFDPAQNAQQRDAVALSRQRVLAMFYSNLAVEAMLRDEPAAAYANFHAAAEQDPTFESIWINLARFYKSHGDTATAEQSLRLALQLNPESYSALISMQQILSQTGRVEEAASYEAQLAARRKRDPHYLYLQGLEALEHGELADARRHFERAAKRITGFKELHEQLFLLYERTGDRKAAAEQQRELAAILSRERATVTYGPKPGSP